MTIEDLSVAAANGVLPEGLTPPERALFYPLRELYAAARSGEMKTPDAKRIKDTLVKQFEYDEAIYRDGARAREYNAGLWRRIEQAGIAYAKSENHTPEADAFYEAVYGVKPGIGVTGNVKEDP